MVKPCQPNVHDNQIALVDPLEGYKADTPTANGHLWHRPNHRLAHNHDHKHDHGPDSHGLSRHDPDLRPKHLCIWVTPALLSEMARLATVVESSS